MKKAKIGKIAAVTLLVFAEFAPVPNVFDHSSNVSIVKAATSNTSTLVPGSTISNPNVSNAAVTVSPNNPSYWPTFKTTGDGTGMHASIGILNLTSGTGTSTASVAIYKQAIDMTQPMSMSTTFEVANTNPSWYPGDFLGFLLTPVSSSGATAGGSGSGLGVQSLANSVVLGRQYTNYFSSWTGLPISLGMSAIPMALIETTDSSGNIANSSGNGSAIYHNSTGTGNVTSTNQSVGTLVPFAGSALTNPWPNGPITTVGTIVKSSVSIQWTPTSSTATTATGNLSLTVDGTTVTDSGITMESTMSAGYCSSDASSQGINQVELTGSSFSYTPGSVPVVINYKDANGNTLATSTTVQTLAGDTIGVNAPQETVNNNDTYDYLTPQISGYAVKSITAAVPAANNSQAAVAQNFANSATNPNVINVVYTPVAAITSRNSKIVQNSAAYPTTWSPADNYVDGVDSNANPIPFSAVTYKVTSAPSGANTQGGTMVDTNTVGNYTVVYSYTDPVKGVITTSCTVTVTPLAVLNSKNSTILKGSVWKTSDNYVSRTDSLRNAIP